MTPYRAPRADSAERVSTYLERLADSFERWVNAQATPDFTEAELKALYTAALSVSNATFEPYKSDLQSASQKLHARLGYKENDR